MKCNLMMFCTRSGLMPPLPLNDSPHTIVLISMLDEEEVETASTFLVLLVTSEIDNKARATDVRLVKFSLGSEWAECNYSFRLFSNSANTRW